MAGFFAKLKALVFGEPTKVDTPARREAPPARPEATGADQSKYKQPPPPVRSAGADREPYFVQVGFDFGTAFCKCICRDVFLDKAWIHMPPGRTNAELPFLMTSAIHYDGARIQHLTDGSGAYVEGGLYHIKMALQSIGLRDWDAPVLKPYRLAVCSTTNSDVAQFVESCTVYLIAGALGNVKREVVGRFAGDVEGDYLAVNMAVPVADADHSGVSSVFDRVLRSAWVLADDLAGHPPIAYSQLREMIEKNRAATEQELVKEACYIYPEVSANVQGFVRSRTSQEGIYLFSDTGAGTVDQSLFLYAKPNGQDHLTYLHAGVFPLGSSVLERRAAMKDGDESWENLERWRQRKESGEPASQLQAARRWVNEELGKGTCQTVAHAKRKLIRRQQINKLRVIFGGGGHCENPYRSAVISQFSSNLFIPDEIDKRRQGTGSLDLGMPIPQDLPLTGNQRRWIGRLTVAYGLSFERGQLATFRLPKETEVPDAKRVWNPSPVTIHAPSKDEV